MLRLGCIFSCARVFRCVHTWAREEEQRDTSSGDVSIVNGGTVVAAAATTTTSGVMLWLNASKEY